MDLVLLRFEIIRGNVEKLPHSSDGGNIPSYTGVDRREVGYGCIRYGGCYLIVHSSSENSARS